MSKRALLIGVSDYQSFEPLPGCAADVRALEPLLSLHADGSPNFDCRILTHYALPGTPLGRSLIEAQLTELLAPGTDIALLYFAGHGALVKNELLLVTEDGSVGAPGIPMSEVFVRVSARSSSFWTAASLERQAPARSSSGT